MVDITKQDSMNPSSSGWIKKYFSVIRSSGVKPIDQLQESDVIFYHILQGTGVVFGYPGSFIYLDEKEAEKWSGKERMKVLYLEALIFTYSFTHFVEPHDMEDEVIEAISEYMESAEISTGKRSLFSFGSLKPDEKLELMIQQRLDFEFKIDKNIWVSYFYNVLVFPDIYFYYKKCINENFDVSRPTRNKVITSLLELIALATNSDGTVQAKEKSIFMLFLQSARLGSEGEEELMDIWENKSGLKQHSIEFDSDYILKKYFLDIAILTLWSDQILDEEESKFLDHLVHQLGFDHIEKDRSLAVVKTFVLTHQHEVAYLQTKNDLSRLYTGLSSNWGRILLRNKNRLSKELSQSGELVKLISISTTRELTKEERKKVRRQFRDLAKSIPALTIFMLPGGTVLLPMILKIIPGLVPSAFVDNKIEDQPLKKDEDEKENDDHHSLD